MDWWEFGDDDLFAFEEDTSSRKRNFDELNELDSLLFTEEDIVRAGIDARDFVREFPHIISDDIWRLFLERDMPDEWIACGGKLPQFASSWKRYYARLRWMYFTHVNDWDLFQSSPSVEAFRNALLTDRVRRVPFVQCYRRYREAFAMERQKNPNNVTVNATKNDMAGNMISCRLARLKSQLVKTYFRRQKGARQEIFSRAVTNDLSSVLEFIKRRNGIPEAAWFARAAFHVVLSGSIIVEWVFWENDQSDGIYHQGIMFRKHPNFGWGACVLMYAPAHDLKMNAWPKLKKTRAAFSSSEDIAIVEKKNYFLYLLMSGRADELSLRAEAILVQTMNLAINRTISTGKSPTNRRRR